MVDSQGLPVVVALGPNVNDWDGRVHVPKMCWHSPGG